MRNATMVLMVSGLLFAASCGSDDESGTLALSGDDDAAAGDDDAAADDDAADDDTATDDEDDDLLGDGICPGSERCECFGNGTCMAGLECWSNKCVDPQAVPSSGSSGGSCHGSEGCDCYRNGTCDNPDVLMCRSGLCVDPPENASVPEPDDDDDTGDDDDDSGGSALACCRSGVCDAAITVHTMSGDPIRAIELNGCVNDNAGRPQDCGGLIERAEGIDARSVTWHLSVTRSSVVRGNASLYTDSADVNAGGAIVSEPNDWAAYGSSNPQLHARVSVRVCDEVVDWLTNSDLFPFETGSSFGVDFDDYID